MKSNDSRERIDNIKAKISLLDLMPTAKPGMQGHSTRIPVLCPLHSDVHYGSAFIFDPGKLTEHFFCFPCNEPLDIFSLLMKTQGLTFRDAMERLEEMAGTGTKIAIAQRAPTIEIQKPGQLYTQRQIDAFLVSMTDADYEFISEKYGVPKEIAIREQIGAMGDGIYVFPSPDFVQQGLYRAVMLYSPQLRLKTAHGNVKWRHWRYSEQAYIYRAPQMKDKQDVIIAEGGKDALIATALGMDASSMTNGAMSWRPEWAEMYQDAKRVIVALDWDIPKPDPKRKQTEGAGQRGTMKILQSLRRGIPIDWSVAASMFSFELWSGFDLADFLTMFPDPWYFDQLVAQCARRYC